MASDNPSTTLDNSQSPHYLHPSDNPSTTLVSQPLNGDNYSTWRRAMRMTLSTKNKLGFVNGTISKPKSPASSVALWDRCNDMVLSWLLNSISSNIAHSVIYADTAQAVWKDLEERFSQSNAPRIYQIKRLIYTLLQEKSSLTAYFMKLKGYWDELASYNTVPNCTCGMLKTLSEYQQQEHVYQFLMGLNDSYSAIRSQILTMDPLPSISKTYSLILQEEKQRELHVTTTSIPDATALSVIKNETNFENYQDNDHNKTCQHPRCDHCKCLGHVKSKCNKLHGYPQKSTNAAHTSMDVDNSCKSISCSSIYPSSWIIDTSASDHITYSMDSLSNVISCDDAKPVHLPNGMTVPITHKAPVLPLPISDLNTHVPSPIPSPNTFDNSSTTAPTPPNPPVPQRSTRHPHPPSHLRDYQISLPSSSSMVLLPPASSSPALTLALLHCTAAQTTHVVGDSMGWVIPPGGAAAYTTWASTKKFMVGDTLVFNFTTGEHDVAQVSKTAFDACTSTTTIGSVITTGPANLTLVSEGDHYYICTVGRHCNIGQKLSIAVQASSSASPTPSKEGPSPSSTPPSSPAPTSVTPADCAPTPVSPPTAGGPTSHTPTPTAAGPTTPSSSSTVAIASFSLSVLSIFMAFFL
ncbi:hypothetical protein HHK36_021443 [Tetracentron sinense]|uniref:Phytocyanin domain-containing protein n=1 Tax=Tetracentron sinense TaxID=13715 RepID=A0A834YWW4_TETSI|nr:hypothetical protein HHK36_021443 [Tetracentron sinense]